MSEFAHLPYAVVRLRLGSAHHSRVKDRDMTEQTPPPAAPEPVEPAAPAAEATVQAPPPPPPAPPVAPPPAKSGRAKKIARVAAPVAILLAIGGYQVSKQADRNEDGTVTKKGDVSSTDIHVGDCVMLPKAATSEEGTEVDELTAVPCGEAHDAEAFAAKKLENASYPGEAKVTGFADRFCGRQFGAFIGKSYNESKLEMSYLYPTKASWAQGDHNVTCMVYKPNAQTTGSLKGTKA